MKCIPKLEYFPHHVSLSILDKVFFRVEQYYYSQEEKKDKFLLRKRLSKSVNCVFAYLKLIYMENFKPALKSFEN